MLIIGSQGINAVGGVLGQPYSPQHFDGRAHLSFLLEEGFTSLVGEFLPRWIVTSLI